MNKTSRYKIRYVARKHPKLLVVLIGSVFAVLTAGFVGAGLAIHHAVPPILSASASLVPEAVRSMDQASQKASGYVEAFVLSAASDWLVQQAARAEVAHVAQGLSCFDALGGPSPKEVIDHAQSKLSNPSLEIDLRSIRQNLSVATPPRNGAAACAGWLIGS